MAPHRSSSRMRPLVIFMAAALSLFIFGGFFSGTRASVPRRRYLQGKNVESALSAGLQRLAANEVFDDSADGGQKSDENSDQVADGVDEDELADLRGERTQTLGSQEESNGEQRGQEREERQSQVEEGAVDDKEGGEETGGGDAKEGDGQNGVEGRGGEEGQVGGEETGGDQGSEGENQQQSGENVEEERGGDVERATEERSKGGEEDSSSRTTQKTEETGGETTGRVGEESSAQETTAAGIPNKKFTLGPKQRGWNKKREAYIAAHPGCNQTKFGTPRVMIVTATEPVQCSNPIGDFLFLKFTKNKIDYARLKGFDIYWAQGILREDFDIYWSKLPLLRTLMLAHPEVEWFWWVDSDAMITDMSFDIPFERYGEYNLVIHGWDVMVYEKKDWFGINAGIYLIRNNRRSLDLLDVWASYGPKGAVRDYWGPKFTKALKSRPSNFESDDQASLVWLLNHRRKRWGHRVHLENSYNLHSFWVPVVEQFEQLMATSHPGYGDNRWPFITHFVGCKLCGLKASYDLDKCIHHIQRAYNFADNQVLNIYGYKHPSLESPLTVPINATSTLRR